MLFHEKIWAGHPSYHFSVGDTVMIGINEGTVTEVREDGRYYRVKYEIKTRGKGETRCDEFPWTSVRPKTVGKTAFTVKNDIRLRYTNVSIHSLIHDHIYFGIDYEPPYQRGYVWSGAQRESLLESIFMGTEIGRFVLRDRDCVDDGPMYEIVDGKQRLRTLTDYYENRFPYKGAFYNDLSEKDKQTFLNHDVSKAILRNYSDEDIIRVFLLINRGGTIMSEDVIRNAEKMLEIMEEKKNG